MNKQKHYHKWSRVIGTQTSPKEARRRADNLHTFKSPIFEMACKLAGVPPTHRQASKWNNGEGIALRFKKIATTQVQHS